MVLLLFMKKQKILLKHSKKGVLSYWYANIVHKESKYTNLHLEQSIKKINHLKTEDISLIVQKALKKCKKKISLFQLLILMYGPRYSSWHCINISLAYCQIITAPQLPNSISGNFQLLHTCAHSTHLHKGTQLVCVSAADSQDSLSYCSLSTGAQPLDPLNFPAPGWKQRWGRVGQQGRGIPRNEAPPHLMPHLLSQLHHKLQLHRENSFPIPPLY